MSNLAHLVRGRVIDLIGVAAVDKLTAAGVALVDGPTYRAFIERKQAEVGRLREVAAAVGRAAGSLTVRAELREEEGVVSCIVTHPNGDELAVVTYLGQLLRAVVAARGGRPATADIAPYDVPAAFIPGPHFPEPENPGTGTSVGAGLLVYGEGHFVYIDRLSEQPEVVVMPGKHRHLHLHVGTDQAGVLLTFTSTEAGWVVGMAQPIHAGDFSTIPWEVVTRAQSGETLRVFIDCPPGTPVAWVIQ